jgi:hypothetical protein
LYDVTSWAARKVIKRSYHHKHKGYPQPQYFRIPFDKLCQKQNHFVRHNALLIQCSVVKKEPDIFVIQGLRGKESRKGAVKCFLRGRLFACRDAKTPIETVILRTYP